MSKTTKYNIPDLVFAEAMFRCEINGKMCHDGSCSICKVAIDFCDNEILELKRNGLGTDARTKQH